MRSLRVVRHQKRGRLALAITGSLFILGAGIVAATFWLRTPDLKIDPSDTALVELGKRVYREQCSACHGNELQGQPNWRIRQSDGLMPAPPHDETGHTWHHPDDVLFVITKRGLVPPHAPEGYESAMPAFEDILTDEEIAAVLAYIKSTWRPKILERQQSVSGQAER